MGESVTFSETDRPVVLLIDTHPDVHDRLAQLLRLEPFELCSATTAVEALATLARQPVDLVMSAARLPDMDGATLLAQIHHDYPIPCACC